MNLSPFAKSSNREKQLAYGGLMLISLAISIVGSLGLQTLVMFLPTLDALLITLSVVSSLYIGYLLYNSQQKIGRLSAYLSFNLISIALLIAFVPMSIYLGWLLLSIWFTRCFFFHRRFLSGCADGILMCLGVVLAYWVITTTSSWFLTFWVFLLVQSLFLYIPKPAAPSTKLAELSRQTVFDEGAQSTQSPISDLEQRRNEFNKAHQAANEALMRLT